eukprot:CAMPEP_0196255926 /NCGR_PEP_ID=MMETSP0913-20130531/55580_1 /TAXON_ID=49265 /ORGANISM="Thalassiosira rotula, Strain GSO102" /LENGTH=106 /DNA_ID=CAMNT_0041543417 /DNA_START=605 /DNA_END=921 /DNA_ORIENTATION=+
MRIRSSRRIFQHCIHVDANFPFYRPRRFLRGIPDPDFIGRGRIRVQRAFATRLVLAVSDLAKVFVRHVFRYFLPANVTDVTAAAARHLIASVALQKLLSTHGPGAG